MAALSPSDTAAAPAQPKSDAYTGMLIVSLVALLAGCALLFFDYRRYPSKEPPPPVKSPAPQGAR